MAPEVLANEGRAYTPGADVWSYGMVIVELLTLSHPYAEHGPDWPRIRAAILAGEPPAFEAPAAPGVPRAPPVVKQLLRACLRLRPEERPDTPEILAHLSTNS